jgi:hypothetical protein
MEFDMSATYSFQAVPEPGTVCLSFLGLATLAFIRRRQRS